MGCAPRLTPRHGSGRNSERVCAAPGPWVRRPRGDRGVRVLQGGDRVRHRNLYLLTSTSEETHVVPPFTRRNVHRTEIPHLRISQEQQMQTAFSRRSLWTQHRRDADVDGVGARREVLGNTGERRHGLHEFDHVGMLLWAAGRICVETAATTAGGACTFSALASRSCVLLSTCRERGAVAWRSLLASPVH